MLSTFATPCEATARIYEDAGIALASTSAAGRMIPEPQLRLYQFHFHHGHSPSSSVMRSTRA